MTQLGLWRHDGRRGLSPPDEEEIAAVVFGAPDEGKSGSVEVLIVLGPAAARRGKAIAGRRLTSLWLQQHSFADGR